MTDINRVMDFYINIACYYYFYKNIKGIFSGVLCDVPTVGVAKNLYSMDGISNDEDHKRRLSLLRKPGDYFALKTSSGSAVGVVSWFHHVCIYSI
jgi:deoxyinosine 3'endonuclease (endonuclease V)